MLVPKDLVLPRTVAVNFVGMKADPLELSSGMATERRTYEIVVYSTLRGDIADLVEVLYADLHKSDSFEYFPDWDSVTDALVQFENITTVYGGKPLSINGKNVYTASIFFDAVSTRGG